jgi:hypothetical protein
MSENQNNMRSARPDASDTRLLSQDTEARVRYLLDALASMDTRIELELSKLDQSRAEESLKDFIKQDTLLRHGERRLPYVTLLEELQGQHRQPTAA